MKANSVDAGKRPPEFKFGMIATKLDDLAIAIQNRVKRHPIHSELRQLHAGLPALLSNTVNVAHWTWRAIRMLTLDPLHREFPSKELATAVPPLSRALLDSLMTFVFVFDKPSDRAAWYYASGWREAREYHDALVRRHGSDPSWAAYLQKHGAWVDSHEKDTGIGPAMRIQPKLATVKWKMKGDTQGWWPIPSKMAKRCSDRNRGDFLAYLYDRYYGELSQDAHLSYMGLARRGGILHDQHLDTSNPERYRSDNVFKALAFYFGLIAEVAAYAGLKEQVTTLRTVWASIPEQAALEDLWARRYRKLLGG
jgi:hypothetical protein